MRRLRSRRSTPWPVCCPREVRWWSAGRSGRRTTRSRTPGWSAALAIDDAGIIYVADNGGYVVRKIDVANNVVTTIAGDGTPGYLDHEDPLQAQFFGMEGMDVVPDGSFLYIADGNRGSDIGERFHRIRRLKLQ